MYQRVNRATGEVENRYTLKEKYEYYKNKANSPKSTNSQGKTIGFTGRVALANEANRIKSRMGRNKRNYDFYGQR